MEIVNSAYKIALAVMGIGAAGLVLCRLYENRNGLASSGNYMSASVFAVLIGFAVFLAAVLGQFTQALRIEPSQPPKSQPVDTDLHTQIAGTMKYTGSAKLEYVYQRIPFNTEKQLVLKSFAEEEPKMGEAWVEQETGKEPVLYVCLGLDVYRAIPLKDLESWRKK